MLQKLLSENTADNNTTIVDNIDFYSALSHFVGFCLALVGCLFIILKIPKMDSLSSLPSGLFFIGSMLALYFASTAFHASHKGSRKHAVLQKLDHAMIYLLIAGTYTPLCLLALPKKEGMTLLLSIYCLAFFGILQAVFFLHYNKWLNSVIYILMGWSCAFLLPVLFKNLSVICFAFLLTGGILYTIGGIIYAIPIKHIKRIGTPFGNHEIFHLFVIGGSIFHYLLVYALL